MEWSRAPLIPTSALDKGERLTTRAGPFPGNTFLGKAPSYLLNRNQTFYSPTNAHVEFIKTKLKLGRLLQHVSVYKETIIREPVSA